jgi:hypothetical protein
MDYQLTPAKLIGNRKMGLRRTKAAGILPAHKLWAIGTGATHRLLEDPLKPAAQRVALSIPVVETQVGFRAAMPPPFMGPYPAAAALGAR